MHVQLNEQVMSQDRAVITAVQFDYERHLSLQYYLLG